MFVKICGVTSVADALAAADAGADAIGLNFVATSSRVVDPAIARGIVAAVSDRLLPIEVFRDRPSAEVLEIVGEARLAAVQLHGAFGHDDLLALRSRVHTVIQVVAVDSGPIDVHPTDDDVVMLDAAEPGGGVPFDWSVVGNLVLRRRVLLAGGLRLDNVADAIRQVRPWGVDVASGVERAPGRKDHDEIRRFVERARSAGQADPS